MTPRRLLPLLALALAACASPSYLVLLDSPDGRPSAVVVDSPNGARSTLSEPGKALALEASGARPLEVAPEQVKKDFGPALAAQPLQPARFILYFETGGIQLTPASRAQLPDILAAVKTHPAADISVTGHTDSVGTDRLNERLAERRAHFVADWLKGSGLQTQAIDVGSHGERNPLVPTPDGVAEPRNRRVEVTIR